MIKLPASPNHEGIIVTSQKALVDLKVNPISYRMNYLLSLFFKFMGPAIGVMVLFTISSTYGQKGVGFYGSFMQGVAILSVILRAGSDYVIIKNVPHKDQNQVNDYVIVLIIRIFFIFAAVYLLIYLLVRTIDVALLIYIRNNYIYFGLALLGFSEFNFLISYLYAINKPLPSIFFQSFCLPFAFLLLILVMPVHYKNIMSSLGLAALILLTIILVKFTKLPQRFFRQAPGRGLRRLQQIKLHGFINGVSNAISEVVLFNSDISILSIFYELDKVAVYTLSSRLVLFYGLYVQLQNTFFSSAISRLSHLTHTSDPLELRSLFWRMVKMNCIFLILYVIFLKIEVILIIWVFGDAYSTLAKYVPYLGIAGYIGILIGFSVNFYFLLIDKRNIRSGLRNFLMLTTYLTSMIYLCHRYEIWGTITAMVLFALLYYLYYFILAIREINKRIRHSA